MRSHLWRGWRDASYELAARQRLADLSRRERAGVSQPWKTIVMVLAAVGIVSTPLIWLLDSPDSGQLTGASIQAAAGIAALIWALFGGSGNRPDDIADRTGETEATDGGTAVAGVKRPHGRGGGSAKAKDTGNAKATGKGSKSVSGIDYS